MTQNVLLVVVLVTVMALAMVDDYGDMVMVSDDDGDGCDYGHGFGIV